MTLGPSALDPLSVPDAKESRMRLIIGSPNRLARSSERPDPVPFPADDPTARRRTPLRRGALALGATVCLLALAPAASAGTDAQALGVAWAQNWDKSQFMHQRPLRVIAIACAAESSDVSFCKAQTLDHRTGKPGCMVVSLGSNDQLLSAAVIRMSLCNSGPAFET